jgi:hypothetical protein
MKDLRTMLLIGFVLLPLSAVANDLGNRDTLRLASAATEGGEYRVAVEVHNDQELAGMDIPLRFGQPGDPPGGPGACTWGSSLRAVGPRTGSAASWNRECT